MTPGPLSAPNSQNASPTSAPGGAAIVQGADGEAAVLLSLDTYNRMRAEPSSYPGDHDLSDGGTIVPAGSGLRAALSRGLRAMVF